MKLGGLGMAGRGLRALFDGGSAAALSDRQLLARFAEGEGAGPAAEWAFEALMVRHGPMVWGLCRRILRDPHAAEDAFQATFLILVRKAGSIRVDDSLGRWLHGVGVRVATRARASGSRARVGIPASIEPAAPGPSDAEASDLRAVIDEEVARLPAAYRSVVVLCHLEGLTRERAAARLGCPVGTVNSRLSRAEGLLKARLARRGLAPASTALAAWLGSTGGTAAASGLVPARLLAATLFAAARVAPGGPIAGAVPATVAALVEASIRGNAMMIWIPATIVSAALAAWAGSGPGPGVGQDPNPAAAAAPAQLPAPPPAPPDLAAQVKQARAEWNASVAAYTARIVGAKTDAERQAVAKTHTVDLLPFAGRFLMLAESDPESPAARDALLWFTEQLWLGNGFPGWGPIRERAEDLLTRHHAGSAEVARAALGMSMQPSQQRKRLVQAAYDRAKDRTAKGYAALALANYLPRDVMGRAGKKMVGRPTYIDAQGKPQFFAPEAEAGIRAEYELDPVPARLEAIRLYEEVVRDYADIPYRAGVLGIGAMTIGQVAQKKLDELINLALGQPAREVEGPDLDDRPLKLADYRGKVVVLVFWASWCPPCVAEVPAANALAERHQGKPFALLGVNCDEDPEAARKAVRDLGIAWPSWRDGSKIKGPCRIEMGPVAERYHVDRLPAVFLIDAQGAIRAKYGKLDGIDEPVAPLLDQAQGPPPSKTPVP